MRYSILLLLCVALFIRCSKDEDGTLTPNEATIDWFGLEDSEDPIDHMRYEIFKKTGISVYYNDTIKSFFWGVDAYGDSIIQHKKFNIEYTLQSTGGKQVVYFLSKDREAIAEGVKFVQDEVIPMLLPEKYPRAILLVRSLISSLWGNVFNRLDDDYVYNALMMTVIGKVEKLKTMSPLEKKGLAAKVAAEHWYNSVAPYNGELTHFYAISQAIPDWAASVTSRDIYKFSMSSTTNKLTYHADWNYFGFLDRNLEKEAYVDDKGVYTSYYTPTNEQDVKAFVAAVLQYETVENFEASYAASPGIEALIAKFKIMKEIVESIKQENNL